MLYIQHMCVCACVWYVCGVYMCVHAIVCVCVCVCVCERERESTCVHVHVCSNVCVLALGDIENMDCRYTNPDIISI